MVRQLRGLHDRVDAANGLVLANGGVLTSENAISLSTRPRSSNSIYPLDDQIPSHLVPVPGPPPVSTGVEGEAIIEVGVHYDSQIRTLGANGERHTPSSTIGRISHDSVMSYVDSSEMDTARLRIMAIWLRWNSLLVGLTSQLDAVGLFGCLLLCLGRICLVFGGIIGCSIGDGRDIH